jgi:hypothetical protein
MNNIFKKYMQRENIDYFIVQLFAVFTMAFIFTLLVLNIQQSPSSDEILQSSAYLAQNNTSSNVTLNKRIHPVPVVQSSNKANTKNEALDDASQNMAVKVTQSSASIVSAEALSSDNKEAANEISATSQIATSEIDSSIDNDNLQTSNSSIQQASAIIVNAISPLTNGSTGNAVVQVSSRSINQNTTTNQSVSSSNNANRIQNNSVANSGTNSGNTTNSQQNLASQAQTDNQDFDDHGDQSLEVFGLNSARTSGVTNGTRLDGSVRRECPPLDRFMERDHERVINIQRSLGCII